MKPYYDHAGVQIFHGDCREILPHLPEVDIVLTDPPYGVGMIYGSGTNDDPNGYWEWFLPLLEDIKKHCSSIIMTHRQEALRWIHGWDHICIWNKPMAFGYAINGWLHHWEPIFIFDKQPDIQYEKDNPKGRKVARFDVITINTTPNNTGHPCPKPIKLMSSLLGMFSSNLVLDPFMGSGTTLVAAKNLGRKAIGIEIEEKYCEIAVNRLSQEVLPF